MSLHSFLACRVYSERSALSVIKISILVIRHLPLVYLSIFSLCLTEEILIMMCHGEDYFWPSLFMDLCPSCLWIRLSFSMLAKFSFIILRWIQLFNQLLIPCLQEPLWPLVLDFFRCHLIFVWVCLPYSVFLWDFWLCLFTCAVF